MAENEPAPAEKPKLSREQFDAILRRAPKDETTESRLTRLHVLAATSKRRADVENWMRSCLEEERGALLVLGGISTFLPDLDPMVDVSMADPGSLHALFFALPEAAGLPVPGREEILALAKLDPAGVREALEPRVEATGRGKGEVLESGRDFAAYFLTESRDLTGRPELGEEESKALGRALLTIGCAALLPDLDAGALSAIPPGSLVDLLDEAPGATPFDGAAAEALERTRQDSLPALARRVRARLPAHGGALDVYILLLERSPEAGEVELLFDLLVEHKRCPFALRAQAILGRIGAPASTHLAARFEEWRDRLPDPGGIAQALRHPSLYGPVKRAFETTGWLGLGEALLSLSQLEGLLERPEGELAARLEAIRRDTPEALLSAAKLGFARLPERVRAHLVCRECGRSFVQDLVRLYVSPAPMGEPGRDFFYPEDVPCPYCRRIGGHPLDPDRLDRIKRYFELLDPLIAAGLDLREMPLRLLSMGEDEKREGNREDEARAIIPALWAARGAAHKANAGPGALMEYAMLLTAIGEDRSAAELAEEALARGPAAPELLLVAAGVFRAAGREERAGEIERQIKARPSPERPRPVRAPSGPVDRNDPCPCGSGKKFKKCCMK